MYSNFPLKSSDIIPPKYQSINPNISRLIKKNNNMIEQEYNNIVNTINNFEIPGDTNTMVKRVDYKDYIKKGTIEDIHTTYDNMTIYENNVTVDNMNKIQGTMVQNNYINIKNMYNPIYSNIDLTNNNYTPNTDIIERKYQPYDAHFGPHIFVNKN